jgi:diguanylate cyclase
LRQLINRATDMPFGKVSISGGIADVLTHSSPSEAFKTADEMLYAAKDKDRNVIVKASAEVAAKAA